MTIPQTKNRRVERNERTGGGGFDPAVQRIERRRERRAGCCRGGGGDTASLSTSFPNFAEKTFCGLFRTQRWSDFPLRRTRTRTRTAVDVTDPTESRMESHTRTPCTCTPIWRWHIPSAHPATVFVMMTDITSWMQPIESPPRKLPIRARTNASSSASAVKLHDESDENGTNRPVLAPPDRSTITAARRPPAYGIVPISN